MAKGKLSSNPVEAHRKAARAREAARNKAQRQKVREEKAVRSDTRGLHAEIRELESKESSLTPVQQKELHSLRAELTKITALKEAFVALHPESKNLVLPERNVKHQESTVHGASSAVVVPNARVPQRSVYYDAVFNPTGAPPPGMPYREKPMTEWATSSQPPLPPGPPPSFPLDADMSNAQDDADSNNSESASQSDDDIMLPVGAPPPRPPSDDDDDYDSDGVVMPKGPPPLPPGPPPSTLYTGPPPGLAPPLPVPVGAFVRPPPVPYPGPPPRPGLYAGPPPGFVAPPPPPPPGVATAPHSHIYGVAPQAFSARAPRGFYPSQGAQLQPPVDPLALPGQTPATYQVWQSRPRPVARPPPNIPTGLFTSTLARPASVAAPSVSASTPAKPVSVTMSAAPQLRDLAKEATTFVPAALRKKQAVERARAALGGLKSGVVPASRADEAQAGEEQRIRKPNLMAALQPHLSSTGSIAGTQKIKGKEKDDYDQFLNDVGDLL